MDHRKEWTSQQTLLRKYVSSTVHFEKAIQVFLDQHAAVHTAGISGGHYWSLQDEVLKGLSSDQLRIILRPGTNSIAWLLWHIARIEDISLNVMVLEQPQLYLSEGWSTQLGTTRLDVGFGMDIDEVEQFSHQVLIKGLLVYRAAVGRSTRKGIPLLNPLQLKEIVPDSTVQSLFDDGSISQKGGALADFYMNRTKGFFLTRTATSHNYIHLNEAGRIGMNIKKSVSNG